MFELWVPVTIVAGFLQNLRSVAQKRLKGELSTASAAYCRFLYALPVVLVYFSGLGILGGFPLPRLNMTFLLFCLTGGICQILFTVFLLWTFSFKSFAVGTALSKLEVVMVAIFAAILLGEKLSPWAVFSILISTFGVFALALGRRKVTWRALAAGLRRKSTLTGIASAAWLGVSSACFRGAIQSLEHQPFFLSASFTLLTVLLLQTIIFGIYISFREPGSFAKLVRNWRWGGVAGFCGASASLFWFTAFALQKAAYVRAVGQTELLFTFVATILFFKEKVSPAEITGIFMVAGGIVILLLSS